jgi:cyclopropane-fatty-acyl-phospholipid synthase
MLPEGNPAWQDEIATTAASFSSCLLGGCMDQQYKGLSDIRRITAPTQSPVDPARRPARGVRAWERAALHWLLKTFGNPPLHFVMWNGEVISNSQDAPVARIHFREPGALYRMLLDAELFFGDDYSSGRIEVEGYFVEFLEQIYRGIAHAPKPGFVRQMLQAWLRRPRNNSLEGSQENIHHHYDLGNDFYRLWLDEEMQYTCAYFAQAAMSLEEAQRAKMDHVCRKLELKPGMTVVEAGCGWGGLARHMALNYGVKVRSYNISHQQIMYATHRARAEGYANRVEYVEDDYRNIRGHFDAFVSVGMLEHVGIDHYPVLGEVAANSLKENGRGLIHSIGRNRPGMMNAWIEKRIFPGGHPPALSEMMQIFEPNRFAVLDVENIRLHYAKTLAYWLERFEANVDTITAQTSPEFVRAWRLYLAGSMAAFTAGDLQLFQVVFAHGVCNEVPWTRWHLYHDREPNKETTWNRVTS